MASKAYDAGVKEYREMYWTPDYVPLDTDLLACFKVTGQPGVPREEVAAAVAAESSTGTWSTVWSEQPPNNSPLMIPKPGKPGKCSTAITKSIWQACRRPW